MEATFLKKTCFPFVPNFPRGEEDQISESLAPSINSEDIAPPFLESDNSITLAGVKIQ
jgi:hypothetical protein